MSPGTAASFTASQRASSASKPIPPVSSVLTTPSTLSQFSLRLRMPSHRPQPSGKASASASAPRVPRRESLLSFIRMKAGSKMVIPISISGLGLVCFFMQCAG